MAATALLVAADSVPDTEVERLVTFLFSQQAFEAAGSAEGMKNPAAELRGILS